MLLEALHYACARLGGEPNPHGHLTELVGIWARLRRQRLAWTAHLARARAICLAAAGALPPERRRVAVVYGAGALNDVPLERLAARFSRIVLADMAFLPATKRQARTLGNVELRHVDLTGALDALPKPEALAAGAGAPVVDLTLGLNELDFAYSANVLSQLPLAVVFELGRRHPAPELSWLRDYAASIVRAHLDALATLPCPVCLVTDVRERGLDHGSAHYEEDLLYGETPDVADSPHETWIWRLAPRGEAHPHLDIERDVLGLLDARDALGGGGHG